MSVRAASRAVVIYYYCALMLIFQIVMADEHDVVYARYFLGKTECGGVPDAMLYLGIVGQCKRTGPSSSAKFTTCLSYQTFSTLNCTGPGGSSAYLSGCQANSDSILIDCMSVPGKSIGKLQTGNSCTKDGAVANAVEQLIVLDICEPAVSEQFSRSVKYTVVDGIFQSTQFNGTADCTGFSQSYTLEIGSCVRFNSGIARKVIPALDWVTLGDLTQSPTRSPNDDNFGKGIPGNENAAMDRYISIFSVMAAVFGALALLF